MGAGRESGLGCSSASGHLFFLLHLGRYSPRDLPSVALAGSWVPRPLYDLEIFVVYAIINSPYPAAVNLDVGTNSLLRLHAVAPKWPPTQLEVDTLYKLKYSLIPALNGSGWLTSSGARTPQFNPSSSPSSCDSNWA